MAPAQRSEVDAAIVVPPRLKRGDRVAIVAPSGPVPKAPFEAGLAILRSRYDVVFDPSIFARDGYLAGSDDRRIDELHERFGCPDVKAIFCARGGYGLTRILPRLDPRALRMRPKPIVGFSDVTALLWWSAFVAGVRPVHGPVVTQFDKLPTAQVEWLFAMLEEPTPKLMPAALERLEPRGDGRAVEGPLVGGNLEVVTRLIGTPTWRPPRGALWLLEDVGELPYRIDRSLTHLRDAGAFASAVGIGFGDFTDCESKDGAPLSSAAVLAERAAAFGVPSWRSVPFGHGARNWAWPFGARARVDAEARGVTLLEGAVR